MKNFSLTSKQGELFYKVEFIPLLEKREIFYGVFIMAYNVTNEIRLEANKQKQEQILLQNSKMAALGEMMSAISHQYKQPLNTLLLLVSDMQEFIKEPKNLAQPNAKVLKNLSNMRMNIELMNETIDVFRNFYKDDFCEKKFDLIDILEDVLYICRPQLQVKNIELNLHYDDASHEITSYPTYLKHVLMNIIMNAKDELVKKAKSEAMFYAKVTLSIVQDENRYIISIEDNGNGIDESMKERIFEPSFTTKDDKGMGMGLYLCRVRTSLRSDILP